MEIRKVGEGAYVVPSYSEQTIIAYDPLMANQTIITAVREEAEGKISPIEHDFTKKDFEQALRKVSRKVKKK